MSRFRQSMVAILAGIVVVASAAQVAAQEPDSPDVALRAQMASITLDSAALPGGYVLAGEAFLTADGLASGDVTAEELTGAGLVSHYASAYRSPDTGNVITTYVSAWSDAAAAEAGFAIVEDEVRTNPDGTFEDEDTNVGETPREITTGSYPDSTDPVVMVSTVDSTFRVDRFLIGTSIETRDGTAPDAAIVLALAATLEGRVTAAINNENPDGADLALVPQVMPVSSLGSGLQAGFLGTRDVEQLYGLQGSSLGGFNASWAEAVGLGSGEAQQPFIAVGVTTFGTEEDALAIVEQIDNLAPEVPNSEAVNGLEIEGADALAAFRFSSQATGATEADSFRIVSVAGTTLVVIDVQGAPGADIAQAAASQLVAAQIACLGQTTCAVPELPAELSAP